VGKAVLKVPEERLEREVSGEKEATLVQEELPEGQDPLVITDSTGEMEHLEPSVHREFVVPQVQGVFLARLSSSDLHPHPHHQEGPHRARAYRCAL